MISSYTNISQTIQPNTTINFNTNRISTGCTVQHNEGTPTFTLAKQGYYYITFNAVATAATAGEITVQLINGSEVIPGATSSVTLAAADDVISLGFASIVKVPPSCCAIDNTAKLTVQNTGIEATFTNVNINITKLC